VAPFPASEKEPFDPKPAKASLEIFSTSKFIIIEAVRAATLWKLAEFLSVENSWKFHRYFIENSSKIHWNFIENSIFFSSSNFKPTWLSILSSFSSGLKVKVVELDFINRSATAAAD
jgi:hypothetical protein